MRPNDETMYNGSTVVNEEQPQVENNGKKKPSWATIGLGAATGILMGAGAIYAATASKGDEEPVANAEKEEPTDQQLAENVEETTTETVETVETVTTEVAQAAPAVHHVTPAVVGHVAVADVTPGMSFSDAFEEARAEVGPGGLFYWRGGIYCTYTKEEWDSMSDAQKHQFASKVNPQYGVSDIHVAQITEEHPEIYITANEVHIHDDGYTITDPDEPLVYVGSEEGVFDGKDVSIDHIIYDGHKGAIVDYKDENEHDFAVVDMNDNENVDNGEILDLETGELLATDFTPLENQGDGEGEVEDVPATPEDDLADNKEDTPEADKVVNDGEPEVNYLGEGDVVIAGKEAHVDAYTVDGHQAAIIDFKDEDSHDVAAIDFNDNLNLDNGEAMDMETGELLNSDLTAITTSTDDIAEITDQPVDL